MQVNFFFFFFEKKIMIKNYIIIINNETHFTQKSSWSRTLKQNINSNVSILFLTYSIFKICSDNIYKFYLISYTVKSILLRIFATREQKQVEMMHEYFKCCFCFLIFQLLYFSDDFAFGFSLTKYTLKTNKQLTKEHRNTG